jgi:anti-sigma regulatory factor (Ser/Thr protein kinase)
MSRRQAARSPPIIAKAAGALCGGGRRAGARRVVFVLRQRGPEPHITIAEVACVRSMERGSCHVHVFPARMTALPDVAAFATRACGAAGFDRAACARLVLLVEELFANTVAHGHGQDSDAPVRIAFEIEPGRVRLSYEDTGPAHDPFAAVTPPDDAAEVEERPVGGLGVLLIAAFASDVEYRRVDGRNRIALVVTGSG